VALLRSVDRNTPSNFEDREPQRYSNGSGCSWPAAIAVIAIACLAVVLFYFMVHGPGFVAKDLADTAGKLRGLFGTEVRVDNQSVTLESREIMELATVQHRIVCVSKYTTTWAGSTATIIVRGEYTAKAGIKLPKGATFEFNERGQVRDETIPKASILSIESNEQKVYHAEQGVLKVLEAKDYEEAFRQNRAQAEREAEKMGLLEEARDRLKERLSDMLPRKVVEGPSTPRRD
jgi:hypothetical protein